MENRQPNNISPENFSVSEQEDNPQAEAVPASAPQSPSERSLVAARGNHTSTGGGDRDLHRRVCTRLIGKPT
jgi:hypothetical protein